MAAKRGDLGPNIPRNGPISSQNGQISQESKTTFFIARSKKLEQGNLLSQPAPFFNLQHDPPFFPVSHRERAINWYCIISVRLLRSYVYVVPASPLETEGRLAFLKVPVPYM